MKKRITAQDVANLANVSRSMVSRYFKPKQGAPVSDANQEKIRQAAEKLNYRPNMTARTLNTGRSGIIGIAVSYLDNPFYSEMLENLSREFQKNGLCVMTFFLTATDDIDEVDRLISQAIDYQLNGIVMLSVSVSSLMAQRCSDAHIPVVLINRKQPRLDENNFIFSVTTDNYKGGQLVADYMQTAGYSRIGYLAGWEFASTQIEREKGFVEQLAKYGKSIAFREDGKFLPSATKTSILKMCSDPKCRPDAIFICNDYMALTAIEVLRYEIGIRVPEDIAIIGFDDISLSTRASFQLTTVKQNTDEMIQYSVQIIKNIIDHKLNEKNIIVDCSLVLRETA